MSNKPMKMLHIFAIADKAIPTKVYNKKNRSTLKEQVAESFESQIIFPNAGWEFVTALSRLCIFKSNYTGETRARISMARVTRPWPSITADRSFANQSSGPINSVDPFIGRNRRDVVTRRSSSLRERTTGTSANYICGI